MRDNQPMSDTKEELLSEQRLMKSSLTDKYYIATKYRVAGNGYQIEEKIDVTDQMEAFLIAHGDMVIGEDEAHHDTDKITQNAQRQRNLLRAEQRARNK